MSRDPHGMTKKREDEIRAAHKDHPYCDACELLAQLDIERAGHKLDLLAVRAESKTLLERATKTTFTLDKPPSKT